MTCLACAHRCSLREGERGICGVRFRSGDELRVPFGYVARRYVRSVETNTIFHVRPGALALTFGMFGCDLACPYCQNWYISQAPRDGGTGTDAPSDTSPSELVGEALAAGCAVLCAAYNEPMVSIEWTLEVFTEAKRQGLVTAVISDGHTTSEALAMLRPVTDVFRVDIKASDERTYRSLGGREQAVWASLVEARRLGYWVEAVTLVVPGLNDEAASLRSIADRLAAIDRDIVWHTNAFFPRYRMRDRGATTVTSLLEATGQGHSAGLRFVYASNLPGVAELGHTRCPECFKVLIARESYQVVGSALTEMGTCSDCGTALPGLWR